MPRHPAWEITPGWACDSHFRSHDRADPPRAGTTVREEGGPAGAFVLRTGSPSTLPPASYGHREGYGLTLLGERA